MFREIREVENNIERERRERDEQERRENILRIAGKHYTDEEIEDAKKFVEDLFNNHGEF